MNKNFSSLGFLIVSGIVLASCSPVVTGNTATDTPPTIAEQATGASAVDTTEPAASSPASALNERTTTDYSQYEIITLLAPDGIPSIDAPQFLWASEADKEYAPEELVLGVSYNGDSRAYSVNLLSSHEIVNDTVGGRPISVTW